MDNATSFDFQPVLTGECITLRPLVDADFENLYAAAADPQIWVQHLEPTRYQREVFRTGFFAGALACGSAFIIIDKASGKVIGSSRYYEWDPAQKEVAIGYTFLARSHWGGTVNRELKAIMLSHAFCWAKTVWFHIGSDNLRSRKAAEKIGARLSHEGVKIIHGRDYPHAWYRIDAPG